MCSTHALCVGEQGHRSEVVYSTLQINTFKLQIHDYKILAVVRKMITSIYGDIYYLSLQCHCLLLINNINCSFITPSCSLLWEISQLLLSHLDILSYLKQTSPLSYAFNSLQAHFYNHTDTLSHLA